MLSRSNLGRHAAAPQVALSESSRPQCGTCFGGGSEKAPVDLREGGPPSPAGRLGHSGAAGAPT
eukprot:3912922-Alexandrium_andersonii.AAC.1